MGNDPSLSPERHVHVLSLFYHPPLKAGGAELRFLEVAKRWEANKSFQHIVLESPPPLHDGSVRVPVPYTDPSLLNDILAGGLFGIAALWKAGREDVDLVLATNNILTYLVPAFLIARLRRTPWVVVVHHFEVLGGGRVEQTLMGIYRAWRHLGRLRAFARALANRLALWLTRKADGVIAVSDVFGRLFERVIVSGNGLDLSQFEEGDVSEKHWQACFVGRLSAEKGVLDLLAAWEKLGGDGTTAPPLFLVGQDQVDVEREIARRGLEGVVTYLGEVSEEEKVRTLKASAVFVTASRSEGWGIGIAEALAAGLRVVAYDLPTLRPLWGSCPYVNLVPTGDVDALAKTAASRLAEDPPSPDATRSCVEGMDWDDVAATDWSFLLSIVERGRSSSGERMAGTKG